MLSNISFQYIYSHQNNQNLLSKLFINVMINLAIHNIEINCAFKPINLHISTTSLVLQINIIHSFYFIKGIREIMLIPKVCKYLKMKNRWQWNNFQSI